MMQLFRFYAWLYRCKVPVLPRLLYMMNRILFSVVLPPSVKVGARTEFAYQGLAVVVHARAVIGDDVYIGPQVIIGGSGGKPEVPVIHNRVSIGAGARVLGPVTIGEGATVAAGAVVLKDVLPGQTVAGIPAKPLQSKRDSA